MCIFRLLMKFALQLFLILILLSCKYDDNKVDCIDPNLIDPNTVCTEEYEPVCGCDEVTYPMLVMQQKVV